MTTLTIKTVELAGATALCIAGAFALWAFIALIGISEGSTDLCTESFKTACEWLAGCVK